LPLFQKKAVEPEPPPPDGKAVLRAMMKNRAVARKMGFHAIVQLTLIQEGALLAFCEGADNLDDMTLDKIAGHYFDNRGYDPESGLLQPRQHEAPTPMGQTPPRAAGRTLEEVRGPERSFASLAGGDGMSKPYAKPAGWG
jgi:hypothetical protein